MDCQQLFARLVTEGDIDPHSAWSMSFVDAIALLDTWRSHPPIRLMISRYLKYPEPEW